jgi:hypothetical protein
MELEFSLIVKAEKSSEIIFSEFILECMKGNLELKK